MDLASLLDERANIALAIRYALALDEHDWPALRELFADAVDIDSQALRGAPPSRMSADAWVERVRSSVELFDAVLHYNLNHRVEIAGDEAACHTYGLAYHQYKTADGPQRFNVCSRYTFKTRRINGEWRIHAMVIQFVMQEGAPPPPRP